MTNKEGQTGLRALIPMRKSELRLNKLELLRNTMQSTKYSYLCTESVLLQYLKGFTSLPLISVTPILFSFS